MTCVICGINHNPKEIEFEDGRPICYGCIFERDELEIAAMVAIERKNDEKINTI